MAVVVMTRYSGGDRESAIARSKRAKGFVEKAGAEWLRLAEIHTGVHAGHRLVSIRYPDWVTYGKVMQSLAGDAEFQKLMSEVRANAKLEERTVLVSMDL